MPADVPRSPFPASTRRRLWGTCGTVLRRGAPRHRHTHTHTQAIPMVRGWKADEVVRALVLEERAKREAQKASDERLSTLRSSPQKKKAGGGKASDESVLSVEGTEQESVPSKVPSVEVVRDFDVVKRLGTEASGVTLDPEEVEREYTNLSDDEEGAASGQTEDQDVVVIED